MNPSFLFAKKWISLLGIISFLLVSPNAFADSPLTSTHFCDAFQHDKMVKYALEKGNVDQKIAKFLMSKKNSTALKAAVVNALGWDTDGKKNAELFQGFLMKKYKVQSKTIPLKNLTADELMCLGYMQAMDDYFHPSNGIEALNKAVDKNPKSFTTAMIRGLVQAQIDFDSDWCKVYRDAADVNENKTLTRDMKEEAVDIIMEYMNLYKNECDKD